MAIRILISDDEPVVHESLRIYFEAEGYEVVDAYDGEEALNKADSSISLMILDITENVYLSLLRRLKSLSSTNASMT